MAHILQALLWRSAPFAALAVIALAWSVVFVASPAAPPSLHHHAVKAFPRTQLSIAAEETNQRTVDAVRRRCLPLITGWGLGF